MGVPSLALSLFVVFEIADQASDIGEVRRQSELATSANGPTGLFVALQNERNWTVTDLFGQGGIIDVQVAGYPETRADTDDAIAAFYAERIPEGVYRELLADEVAKLVKVTG